MAPPILGGGVPVCVSSRVSQQQSPCAGTAERGKTLLLGRADTTRDVPPRKAELLKPIFLSQRFEVRAASPALGDRLRETDESAVSPLVVSSVFVWLWCLFFSSDMDHLEKEHRSDDEADYEDEEVDPRIQVINLYF